MALEILVGMIASGKSEYARSRADGGALVIAHDDLTAMLHARYRYEPVLRALYRSMEEALVAHAHFVGRDVVIDRTHLTRESRSRWVRFGETLDARGPVPVVAVVFPDESPEVHARRRYECDARGRSYGEWLRVACHHAEQAAAEPIGLDEGFAEVRCVAPRDL